jgi:spermidine/putrescine transport system permease protein
MTAGTASIPVRRSRPSALARAFAFVRYHVLTAYAVLAFVYLMLPIAVVIVFSFNDPVGRFNFTWQGFTLDNWLNPFGFPGLREAVEKSLEIAFFSSIFATALGTLMGLALVRHRFYGRGATNLLVFMPMASPEIVLGASLLTLFLNRPLGVEIPLGFWTILIAHIMFNISYVVVTVRARLIGFDRHLEEAAMDLGANEFVTFVRVTLPLIAPGILAALLLTFSLSVDDFVITYLNAGAVQTFPLFVWGAARVAVPPQINVIGTAIFAVAILLMFVNVLVQRRRTLKGA